MSSDSISELDRSDIESIKEDLINSIPSETYSEPTSPVYGTVCYESLNLVTRSARPSPKSRPVSKMQNLISIY